MTNYDSIISPVPGTVFLQPSPEEEVYVKEGARVKQGDIIALVEIMKSFYEIKVEQAGEVESFSVRNGDTINAGKEIASIKITENMVKGE